MKYLGARLPQVELFGVINLKLEEKNGLTKEYYNYQFSEFFAFSK